MIRLLDWTLLSYSDLIDIYLVKRFNPNLEFLTFYREFKLKEIHYYDHDLARWLEYSKFPH